MDEFVWPEDICPMSFSLYCDPNVKSFGAEPGNDVLEDHWTASMAVDGLSGEAKDKLVSLKNRLEGSLNTVRLYHFARPSPRGTATVSYGLLESAPKGSASVVIVTDPQVTLLPGDMLKVGDLLLQVAEPATADTSGRMEVILVNRLRKALTGVNRSGSAWQLSASNVLTAVAAGAPRYYYDSYYCNAFYSSQELQASTWSKTNTAVEAGLSIGGITNAMRVYTGSTPNCFISQSVRYAIGTPVTVVCRILAGNSQESSFMFRTSAVSRSVRITWAAGVPSVATADASIAASIEAVGAGWYDVVLTTTLDELNQGFRIYPDIVSTSAVVADMYIYVQHVAAYFGNIKQQYVASGATHATLGWAAVGPAKLLIERASSNLISRSSDLSVAGWFGSCSSTSNPSLVAYGVVPFNTITKTTAATSEPRANMFTSASAMTTISVTLVVMAGSVDTADVGLYSSASPGWGYTSMRDFEVVSGPGLLATTSSPSLFRLTRLSSIEPTVVRLRRTYVEASASCGVYIYPGTSNSTTIGNSINVTAVQAELGESTSHNPTAGTVVTRQADSASAVELNKPSVPFRLESSGSSTFRMAGLDATSLTFTEHIT